MYNLTSLLCIIILNSRFAGMEARGLFVHEPQATRHKNTVHVGRSPSHATFDLTLNTLTSSSQLAFHPPLQLNPSQTFKMQAFDESCDIRCDVKGIRLHHPRVVYSTDPMACPTFLHMHNNKGFCMPDTISTSSLIIKHQAPTTNEWEYFYLTSDLKPPRGHGTDDTQEYRPMRLGRCVPVGMKVKYPDNFRLGKFQEVIELVHIHKHENESQEAFNRRMSIKGFNQRPPVSLGDLSAQVTSIEEIQTAYKKWHASSREGRRPSITIERYQQTLYTPTSYTSNGEDEYYHLQIPIDEVGPGVSKLAGSDNGSLVCEWGQEVGTIGNPGGKILGIVESLSTWTTVDYAVVQPMLFVVEDLRDRLYALFHPGEWQ
ncbi:hypothetical protein E0Z10_g5275 [Xylaria hypoxylon]|uniref:Peptidase A1 domain-containing protein n=1 Tax=Xylaria hypoxylon TaxID=37992 RepID=A0A4Z0YU64_9PEZI|nr:hypothetical protein E0Z10_g5275 [Xylaria hypoxylon]